MLNPLNEVTSKLAVGHGIPLPSSASCRWLRIPQAHSWAAAIGSDEQNAGFLQRRLHRKDRPLLWSAAKLNARNRPLWNAACVGKILLSPSDQAASSADLSRRDDIPDDVFTCGHSVIMSFLMTFRKGTRPSEVLPAPALGLTTTCSSGELAMATRAHSTPVSATRRRRQPVVPAAPDARHKLDERRPSIEPADLPSQAAIAKMLAPLWVRHQELDAEADRCRKTGKLNESEAFAIGADHLSTRIRRLEDYAMAVRPVTPQDAVAQLVLLHADIFDTTETSSDPECRLVRHRLEVAAYAITILAELASFDLNPLSSHYLQSAERMIVRGEVPA
jgi:hypothetical protein